MTVYSQSEIQNLCRSVGFDQHSALIMSAIAMAESGGDEKRTSPPNNDGSVDRGLYQINSRWHKEVSNSCAYDAVCSTHEVWRISNHGTDFNQWSTYTNGSYLTYMGTGATGPVGSTGVAANAGALVIPRNEEYWLDSIYHGYITTFSGGDTPHYADDIPLPLDTPIVTPVAGTVVKSDYAVWSGLPGGGEVFIQPDSTEKGIPTHADFYVYHLDQLNVTQGQHVNEGDVLGLSGGQNSGGQHPTASLWSSGPHLHVGWFTGYKSPNGQWSRPYGPDITPFLQSLANGTKQLASNGASSTATAAAATAAGYVALTDLVHQTLTEHPGFYGVALALDEAEMYPGPINVMSGQFDVPGAIRSVLLTIGDNALPTAIRGFFILMGLVLILGLLWNVVRDSGVIEAVGEVL